MPSAPLRVLVLSSCFPHPKNLGFGVWALSQAQTLMRHGVDLRVVSPTPWVPEWLGWLGMARWAADSPPETVIDGVPVAFPRWPFYYTGFMKPLMRRWPTPVFRLGWPLLEKHLLDEVARHRPQVILANHGHDGGEMARLIQRRTGLPFIVAEHDFGEISDCEYLPARKAHYKRVMDSASSVLAVSERMKADIARLFPGTRVVVARYGRDPLPETMFTRPRPPELEGKLTVLCACSLTRRKGVQLLVEAFSRIVEHHPAAELRIAGEGPERASISETIRRLGMQDRVKLLGSLPHDTLLQEMAWADVFALTGWDEPFATVYVEALAAGLPIVCCNDGGICDILQEGGQGFMVPPRDMTATSQALHTLLRDKALRTQMSQAASRLFREKLTPASYASSIIRELENAIVAKKPSVR